MYKPSFGKNGQMKFRNQHEFYTFLGYLAKSDSSTSLTWEHNEEQGAWGSEGRIQIHTNNMPEIGILTLTAGNGGNVVNRINCNEFVEEICTNHNFKCGDTQDADKIRETVPEQCKPDFDRGLKM